VTASLPALRERLRQSAIRAAGRAHATVYRASRGRVLGRIAGMPVLLLTTAGRRTGKPRTTPLTFFRDGDDLVVVASNGGADRAPGWSLNLRRNPRAVVAIGTAEVPVTARTASAAERARLWPEIVATHDGYAAYQRRTARRIPVVILTPEGTRRP
jgi:deazaflavin-dependent oxidoreductase (nitroreductase family)